MAMQSTTTHNPGPTIWAGTSPIITRALTARHRLLAGQVTNSDEVQEAAAADYIDALQAVMPLTATDLRDLRGKLDLAENEVRAIIAPAAKLEFLAWGLLSGALADLDRIIAAEAVPAAPSTACPEYLTWRSWWSAAISADRRGLKSSRLEEAKTAGEPISEAEVAQAESEYQLLCDAAGALGREVDRLSMATPVGQAARLHRLAVLTGPCGAPADDPSGEPERYLLAMLEELAPHLPRDMVEALADPFGNAAAEEGDQ